MLFNATLLRVDDPPPSAPGATISLRCAVGVPTAGELAEAGGMGLAATAVLYLPMETLPLAGAPESGQYVTARLDGCPPATYRVLHATDRVGGVLSHVRLFLTEA